MNCYQFTAIDGMKLKFKVEANPDQYLQIAGEQINTSIRPTTENCLRYKCWSQYKTQNPCSKSEWDKLAIRFNHTCFRFILSHVPEYDDLGIEDQFGTKYYVTFRPSLWYEKIMLFFKPWNSSDQYYEKGLQIYNWKKTQPLGIKARLSLYEVNAGYVTSWMIDTLDEATAENFLAKVTMNVTFL